MVTWAAGAGASGLLLAEKPLLKQLDPDTRARVLGALGGLILLGFFLVALVWLGGRITRRYIRRGEKLSRAPGISGDDWSRGQTAGDEAEDEL